MTAVVFSICGTIAVVVLGAYGLTWRLMAWEREDVRRFEEQREAEKIICPSLRGMTTANGPITLRCELGENHSGPHTAKAENYARIYWE